MRTGFWWGQLKGRRDHLEDPDGDGSIILKIHLKEIGIGGGMDRIYLAEDRDKWRAVVNKAINFGVS